MDKRAVLSLCKKYAAPAGIDPLTFLALIQRESSFNEAVPPRLEPAFAKRYTFKQDLATSSEVLLACSYGLTQMMGQSLLERGYFKYFIGWHNAKYPLSTPLTIFDSQMAICKGVDQYAIEPEWHVEWGVKHFLTKLAFAKGDVHKALQAWNGGGNPHYADEVFTFREQLVKEFL